MTAQSPSSFYFQRFGFCGRQILRPAPLDLGLVVVIPCFDEPDLIGSLESLWHCDRAACSVEVIVVINSAANSSAEVRSRNQRTLEEATGWALRHSEPRMSFHLLHFPDLPPKQAGVGLARKIGMDEAVRRFDDSHNTKGLIGCLDADCRCEPNYLTSLERHFQENPRSPGCSVYFEHPLADSPGSQADEAIAGYELHLRYYVQALRYAGFPFAHHTIGSCMAVRAEAYKKQGGMNKRRAGEDFYFLQKIIPLGNFTDLTETAVIPSSRASDRVPFGTGKAVRDYLTGQQNWTYPLQAFLDLKAFFDCLPQLYRPKVISVPQLPGSLAESIRTFLTAENFSETLEEMVENTSSEAAFRKRFFHWFNGFQAMKFIHHARDHFYGKKSVTEEAQRLLSLKSEDPQAGKPAPRGNSEGHPGGLLCVRELLSIYRNLDRNGR